VGPLGWMRRRRTRVDHGGGTVSTRYDVVVIGGGPGGYAAAIAAGRAKKRVALVEKDRIGGTCLNRGCIPSKVLLASAHLYHRALGCSLRPPSRGGARGPAPAMGVVVSDVRVDLGQIHKRKAEIVKQNVEGVEHVLKLRKVEILAGVGRLRGDGRVVVERDDGASQEIEGEHLILAFGSEPARLPIPGLEGDGVWTSDDALAFEGIPGSITVIGAGAVGLEFADYFNAMGSRVTVVELLERALPIADAAISKELARSLKKAGIALHTSAKVTRAERRDGKIVVTFEKGGKEESTASDVVLVAAGRRPAISDVGLEEASIATENGRILVDERMRTNVPGVYAVGDALGSGGMMLAHSAFKEAEVAVANICGKDATMDYQAVPSAVYCSPEIAWVGLTEEQAAASHAIRTGMYLVRANSRALAEGNWDGFAKTVCHADTGKLLGVHIIGPNATELIAAASAAIGLGASAEQYVERVTHPHPTESEILFESIADSIGAALHKP
jgi:dihydrolipoamide dehydrogenase